MKDNTQAPQKVLRLPDLDRATRPGPSGFGHERRGSDIGLSFFSQVSRTVSSVSELSFLVEQIMRMTEKALKATATSVLLIDQNKQEMFFEFANGPAGNKLEEVRFSIQSGIAGWVARHGEPAIVNDVTKDARFYVDIDRYTGFTTRSILCTPLKVRGRVIGVIEALNKRDGSDFTEQDLELLNSVASTAAIAIALKQAEDALRSSEAHYQTLLKSLTDPVLQFREGTVAWCNDRVEELYGYSKEALTGKTATFFFPEVESPAEFAGEIIAEIEQRGAARRTGRFERGDGRAVDVEYTFSQVAGGNPVELVAVARVVPTGPKATGS